MERETKVIEKVYGSAERKERKENDHLPPQLQSLLPSMSLPQNPHPWDAWLWRERRGVGQNTKKRTEKRFVVRIN